MKLQAMIFDLDGVITDTAHLHFLAWRSVAQEIGIVIDEQINEQLKGISRMASLERILQVGGKAQTFTQAQKNEIAEHKNARYVDLLQTLDSNAILPGITSLLAMLKQQGIKIGLASVSLNAPAILTALGLTTAFDFCADARRITHSKPDPEIFLAACAGIGISPLHCIGVEDSMAGIQAINACPMLSIGIGKTLIEADLQLNSTEELTWPCIARFWEYSKKAAITRRERN